MKQSAGILVYKIENGEPLVLLTHPGGPFWARKDTWSIPKGETEEDEDLMSAALREFGEETSLKLPEKEFVNLGDAKQGSSKVNYIWAIETVLDLKNFKCTSMVKMEWPPHSGQQTEFPESDRARWFDLATAKQKLFKSQTAFIDRLAEHLKLKIPPEPEQQSLL